MKLRLRENSVRLRLQKSEITQLGETGSVTETIYFSSEKSFIFTIRTDQNADSVFAVFDDNEISIQLPKAVAKEWIETEKVGLKYDQSAGQGRTLNILIEKDFKCLTERSEDESDMFPNPNEVH